MATLSRSTFPISDRFLPRSIISIAVLLASAWVIASAPLLPLLLGIGAATTVLLLLRWPWLIWLGIGAALPVASGVKLGPLSLTDFALAAAVALWFADGVRRRSLRLHNSPVIVAIVLYIAAIYLSLLAAKDLGEAGREVVKWLEVLVVLLIAREMLPPTQTPWLVAALLLGGVGQALFGLYQFIYRIGPDWFLLLGRFMRASGSFGQPNPLAGYLGLTLPVAVSLALWAWGKGVRNAGPKGHPGMRNCTTQYEARRWHYLALAIVYTLAALLIAAGLIASWSRGGWLGAAVAMAVVVLVRSRQAAISGAIVALLLLIALLLGSFSPRLIPEAIRTRIEDIPTFLGLTDVLQQPVTDENFSVLERVAHWAAAVRMWERAPWLGVGPGNYAIIYPEVRLPRWQEPLGHAHNIYLNGLAETGLLGLTSFLVLWVVIIAWTWQQFGRAVQQKETWQAALAVGILGVIAHLSVHNFFDNLLVQGMYIHIALWLTILQSSELVVE